LTLSLDAELALSSLSSRDDDAEEDEADDDDDDDVDWRRRLEGM
jgi:hypothetical protein